MDNTNEWDYLEEEILTRKRKKDLYYLQSLSLQHDKILCHYPDLNSSTKAYA